MKSFRSMFRRQSVTEHDSPCLSLACGSRLRNTVRLSLQGEEAFLQQLSTVVEIIQVALKNNATRASVP